MNTRKTIAIAAVTLLGIALVSCKGRRADGTPNGETVDVVLTPTVNAANTLSADLPSSAGDTAASTQPGADAPAH